MKIQHTEEPAEEVSKILQKIFGETQTPVLFLVSGGSAFTVLEKSYEKVLNKNVTVAMVDERFSADEKINNFLQLKQTVFFKNLLTAGGLFFDSSPAKGESIASLTQRFHSFLREWRRQHTDGTVVALLGMGEDGHTAGVMPFPENQKLFKHLFLEDEWVVGYDAKEKNQYPLRITTTLTFLKNQVDKAVVFVHGEKKRPALEKVVSVDGSLALTPARIWREMKNVVVVTDVEISSF